MCGTDRSVHKQSNEIGETMSVNVTCWLTDTRCTGCNAGFHLEYQELYTCSDGSGRLVSYGCGSC
jgi:hypothetical protein